LTKRQGANSR